MMMDASCRPRMPRPAIAAPAMAPTAAPRHHPVGRSPKAAASSPARRAIASEMATKTRPLTTKAQLPPGRRAVPPSTKEPALPQPTRSATNIQITASPPWLVRDQGGRVDVVADEPDPLTVHAPVEFLRPAFREFGLVRHLDVASGIRADLIPTEESGLLGARHVAQLAVNGREQLGELHTCRGTLEEVVGLLPHLVPALAVELLMKARDRILCRALRREAAAGRYDDHRDESQCRNEPHRAPR